MQVVETSDPESTRSRAWLAESVGVTVTSTEDWSRSESQVQLTKVRVTVRTRNIDSEMESLFSAPAVMSRQLGAARRNLAASPSPAGDRPWGQVCTQ